MPPTPNPPNPRVVIYYQTHHTSSGAPISVLPLLTTPNAKPTHLILAALHLNATPPSDNNNGSNSSSSPQSPHLTLNDHPPAHPRNATLWAELTVLRSSGTKILALLGGAAGGTYSKLDTSSASSFNAAYAPLASFIQQYSLDGLDLDVEEPMSLTGIVRLIDRLRSDFGPEFIITLAPVAAALLNATANLSGFSYRELEAQRGGEVAWYNAQFYCGWGEAWTEGMYDAIIRTGWAPNKVVMGLVTTPENGSGWVPLVVVRGVLGRLGARYGTVFGGVMGWEYFNARPGGKERPWEWVVLMNRVLGRASEADALTLEENREAETLIRRRMEEMAEVRRRQEEVMRWQDELRRRPKGEAKSMLQRETPFLADGSDASEIEAQLPEPFEYYSEGDEDVILSPPEPFEYFTDGSLEE